MRYPILRKQQLTIYVHCNRAFKNWNQSEDDILNELSLITISRPELELFQVSTHIFLLNLRFPKRVRPWLVAFQRIMPRRF